MGKKDCQLVHIEGNINAPTTGGPVTYTAARGGSSMIIDSLKPVYRARAELGAVQVETATETGEFTG